MLLDILRELYPDALPGVLKVISTYKHYSKHGIDNIDTMCYFISQLAHESWQFKHMKEVITPEKAEARYGVGTRVGRILGNTRKGDGSKYIGRGLIQLTGRWNYSHFGKVLGLDLINNPDHLLVPSTALQCALEFWKFKGLTTLPEKDTIRIISRKINGGENGLRDRIHQYERLKAALVRR